MIATFWSRSRCQIEEIIKERKKIIDCEKTFGSKRTAVRFYSVPFPICLAGSSCWPKQGVAWIAHVSDVGTYTGELIPVLCIQYWRWFSTAN